MGSGVLMEYTLSFKSSFRSNFTQGHDFTVRKTLVFWFVYQTCIQCKYKCIQLSK